MKNQPDSEFASSSVRTRRQGEITSRESFRTFNRVLLILLVLTSSATILILTGTGPWYLALFPLFALIVLVFAYASIFLSKMRRISL